MEQSPIPEVINNRYAVKETIGRGGMATVYLATDRRLGRDVAIKVLKPELARDDSFQQRFQREAQAVAGLNHHTITSVYDTGEIPPAVPQDAACPFIVMEYVPGHTLRQLIREDGLTRDTAIHAMNGILDALAYSHRSGIVHRDIKPANVIITPDNRVKVMDFGIARAIEDTQAALTQTQAVLGTAQYLSPEQARGENVDARSDLYSAACVFFEMLTGRAPFVGEASVDIAAQHVRDAPPAPSELTPQLPRAFDEFTTKALAKSRADRFQSAEEMQRALLHLKDVPDAEQTTVTPPVTAPLGAAGLGAGAAAGAAGVGGAAGQQPPVFTITSAQDGSSRGPATGRGAGGPMDPDDPGARRPAQEPGSGSAPAVRRRRSPLLWLLPLLLLLAAAVVAAVLWTNRGPDTVAVPSVVGAEVDDAQQELQDAGLDVDLEEQLSTEVPQDHVISVEPGEGTEVDEGSTVTLTVSEGSETVTVPADLTGQSEVYAREILSAAGLNPLDATRSTNSATVAEGLVVATDPDSGQVVARDSDITIVLSTGNVTVPDVTGRSQGDAEAALGAPDVRLPVAIAAAETNSAPPGTVIRQSSPGGEDVSQGTTITLTIAITPAPEPTQSSEPAPGGGSGTPEPSSPSPSPSPTAPDEDSSTPPDEDDEDTPSTPAEDESPSSAEPSTAAEEEEPEPSAAPTTVDGDATADLPTADASSGDSGTETGTEQAGGAPTASSGAGGGADRV